MPTDTCQMDRDRGHSAPPDDRPPPPAPDDGLDGETFRATAASLVALALPNIAATVTRMLMGFVDFVMVSWLGTDAQAAISPATFVVFTVVCGGMGIATAVTTYAAQALGRGEPHEGSAYAWQSLYLAAFLGLVTVPLAGLVEPFWNYIGHADAVRAQEIAYTRIALWSVAPSILVSGLDGFFNGVQRPGVAFGGALVALLSNAVLNYALIFGHWGFPRLESGGAALATVVGWTLRAAVLAAVFLGPTFASRFATRRTWRPSRSRLMGLFHVGAPTAVQWVLDLSAWALFMTVIMGRFGKEAMAATNIAIQYMHLSFMPAVGVGMALTSLVGHAIGEGRYELARRRVLAGLLINVGFMGSMAFLFWLGRGPLMRLLSADPGVMAIGSVILLWAASFQVFDATAMTYNCALRGAGDTRWPTAMFLLTSWGVFIGGGWLVSRTWPSLGIHGPWMMCSLYIAVLGLGLWLRFYLGGWTRIRLFERGR